MMRKHQAIVKINHGGNYGLKHLQENYSNKVGHDGACRAKDSHYQLFAQLRRGQSICQKKYSSTYYRKSSKNTNHAKREDQCALPQSLIIIAFKFCRIN